MACCIPPRSPNQHSTGTNLDQCRTAFISNGIPAAYLPVVKLTRILSEDCGSRFKTTPTSEISFASSKESSNNETVEHDSGPDQEKMDLERTSDSSEISHPKTNRMLRSRSHKKKQKSSTPSFETSSSSDESNGRKCPICKREFSRPWRLKAHMASHTGLPSFKCDHEGCRKEYSYGQHLERHKQTAHSDVVIVVSKLRCPVPDCGISLASLLNLKKHLQRFHDESNQFPCSMCKKVFRKHKQLSLHLQEHSTEPLFRCEICKVSFTAEQRLKKHMKRHTTFKCDVHGCDLSFSNFSSLRKHKADHNKCFTSLICAHCSKVLKNKSSLRAHVKSHMGESSVFNCPYEGCSRFYLHKRNLDHHIRYYHQKRSRYVCTWEGCNLQLASRKSLECHLNVHRFGKRPPRSSSKKRAKRKDAGQIKKAFAPKLAGLIVPYSVEKKLLKKESVASTVMDCTAEDEEYVQIPYRGDTALRQEPKLNDSLNALYARRAHRGNTVDESHITNDSHTSLEGGTPRLISTEYERAGDETKSPSILAHLGNVVCSWDDVMLSSDAIKESRFESNEKMCEIGAPPGDDMEFNIDIVKEETGLWD